MKILQAIRILCECNKRHERYEVEHRTRPGKSAVLGSSIKAENDFSPMFGRW